MVLLRGYRQVRLRGARRGHKGENCFISSTRLERDRNKEKEKEDRFGASYRLRHLDVTHKMTISSLRESQSRERMQLFLPRSLSLPNDGVATEPDECIAQKIASLSKPLSLPYRHLMQGNYKYVHTETQTFFSLFQKQTLYSFVFLSFIHKKNNTTGHTQSCQQNNIKTKNKENKTQDNE